MNLLLAWLVIRLATEMVPNPALARLIAVLTWSVAALRKHRTFSARRSRCWIALR